MATPQMPHITLLLLLKHLLIKLKYLFDISLARITPSLFGSGLCQYFFDCPPQRVRVGARNQVDSTGTHSIVGSDDRRPDEQRFAHRDRIAVVKRRAKKQIALRDGAQSDRMRNVTA